MKHVLEWSGMWIVGLGFVIAGLGWAVVLIGGAVLFWSVLRDRLRVRKTEDLDDVGFN